MKFLSKILKVNLRSIYLNFYLLPFAQAIHLPILVSGNVKIDSLYRGGVQIHSDKLKVGLIQIGYRAVGIIDSRYERSILQISRAGRLVFYGRCFLGSGIRMTITGVCEIGNNVNVSGNTSICCYEKVKIGADSLVSWDCLLMDTDFHKIYDNQNNLTNSNKAIEIGNHVWVGAKSTLLKGSVIPDSSVVAACSLYSGIQKEKNCIYGGIPAKLIKRNISWEK